MRDAMPHPDFNDAGVDLVVRCMTYSPSSRTTARDALAHAYFDDFNTETIGEAPF